jgi:two-component system, NarL family, response regulator LiaR
MRVYVNSPHFMLQEGLSILVFSFGYTVAAEVDAEVAIRDLSCSVNYPPPFAIPTLALIAEGEMNAEKALLLGYRGYVQASQDAAQLKAALQALRKGENWAERKIIARALGNHTGSTRSSFEQEVDALTRREREVFDLLVVGLSNRAIAEQMHIAEKTVKGYTSSLYDKLGVAGRTNLILYYHQRPLAHPKSVQL